MDHPRPPTSNNSDPDALVFIITISTTMTMAQSSGAGLSNRTSDSSKLAPCPAITKTPLGHCHHWCAGAITSIVECTLPSQPPFLAAIAWLLYFPLGHCWVEHFMIRRSLAHSLTLQPMPLPLSPAASSAQTLRTNTERERRSFVWSWSTWSAGKETQAQTSTLASPAILQPCPSATGPASCLSCAGWGAQFPWVPLLTYIYYHYLFLPARSSKTLAT